MGVKGPALALSVSQVLNMVGLSIYLSRIEEFKEAWYWPNA
jgi:Na+-driven multidrug efflux pump